MKTIKKTKMLMTVLCLLSALTLFNQKANAGMIDLGWSYDQGPFSTYGTWQDYLWYFKSSFDMTKDNNDVIVFNASVDDGLDLYINESLVYQGSHLPMSNPATVTIDITDYVTNGYNDISMLNANGILNSGYGWGGINANLTLNGSIFMSTSDNYWWNIKYTSNTAPPQDSMRRAR